MRHRHGAGAFIQPSEQAINPITSREIRIEVGGAVTIGDGSLVRAQLLVPNAKFTMGRFAALLGAAWARTISIGTQSFVGRDTNGGFHTQTPAVPAP